MPELGATTDPRALVAGDADGLRALARTMVAYAGDLREAGDGLQRLASPEGWRGPAADRFRGRFAVAPARWLDAADSFTSAGRALDVYAETVSWAQDQAASAIRSWEDGETASARAIGGPIDPGDALREQAGATLLRARSELASAGDAAAAAISAAADRAPVGAGFWRSIVDGATEIGRDTINAIASVGNAALHHPEAVATMAGGAALIAGGVAGEAGGIVLDSTVVAAPAGAAVAAAAAVPIVAGAGMVTAGAMQVATNATGDDAVSPAGNGPPPTPPTPPTPVRPPAAVRPTITDPKLDNIVGELYRGVSYSGRAGNGTTADAVRYERASGERVGNKTHTKKANDTVRALRNWLRRHPKATPADRGVAQNEMNDLLDALGRL